KSLVEMRAKAGRTETRVFPVPTRVEKAEKDRLDAARVAARERFNPFLWHIPESARDEYWETIEVTYQSYFAYEEVVASFTRTGIDIGSLLYAMQRLAAHLSGRSTLQWSLPPEDKCSSMIAAYGWARPATAPSFESPADERASETVTPQPPVRLKEAV